MQIFWLKRNLRLQDSVPFFESMRAHRKSGPVLPLYCHEPSLIRQPDVARQHQVFIQETLNELDYELRALGGHLLQAVGEAVDVLDRIHRIQPITRIWTHRETTQKSQYDRDKAVKAWCIEHSVQLMEVEQNGITRGSQQPLSFPDYFAKSRASTLRDPTGSDLAQRFASMPFASCDPRDIPAAAGEDKRLRQKGGRINAMKNLERFFRVNKVKRYPFQISSPNTAWEGCARISTYLAYGVISDREVFQEMDRVVTEAHGQMNPDQFDKFQGNARFFLDRLSWRRQYIQTLENNPDVEFKCMLPQFEGVREAEFSEAYFEAWKAGRTGFPYVDAAMRCLNETGWINMRLRATMVSFSTMNLWLPTTKVARYLATEFLDYDPGIHHPIHQLIAGTTEFSDLMVYDVVKQGVDHDKEAAFIRQWVPELADLSAEEIHGLDQARSSLSREAEALGLMPYPEPIVDRKITAKRAKERVSALKKNLPDIPAGSAVGAGGHEAAQQSLF